MVIKFSKATSRSIGVIAIVFLIFGLLLAYIEWVAFDLKFYNREYKILNISQATGMEQDELLKTTEELLKYIRGKRDNLKVLSVVDGEKQLVFNEREIDHMVDVKDLFTLAFRLRWISIGIFALLVALMFGVKGKDAFRDLSVSYLTVLVILIIFAIILVSLILIDFTAVWNKFHHIFFNNDLWLLNPETDILIQMLPEKFFFDIVMRIFTFFGLTLIALALCSGMILYKSSKDIPEENGC